MLEEGRWNESHGLRELVDGLGSVVFGWGVVFRIWM